MRNRLLDRMAMQHAVAHPLYTIAKTAAKVPLAWVQQQSVVRSAFTAILLLPLFGLACAAVACRGRDLTPVWLPLVVFNLAAAAIFVEAIPMRYALPWVPLLAVLAAAGLRRGVDPVKN